MLAKLLAFASLTEIGTGLAVIVAPNIVVTLLLAGDVSGVGIAVARCFGVALLALGLACWPARQQAASGSAAVRAMLVYNALIAMFLVYLYTVAHVRGVLLWPGALLHATVAILLVLAWRAERSTFAAAE